MNPTTTSDITLSEWQTLSPVDTPELAGVFLDRSPQVRQVVDGLNKSRMLELTELRDGIQISARSHVGRIRIGNLCITVLPKLNATSLLRLLQYTYGFRKLSLMTESSHIVGQAGFEDLLVSQLNAEVAELISRGLLKTYVRQDERLASPRGRININRLALDGGTITATLPCQHYSRIEDTFLNRILMAGLRLAASVASMVELRRESRRLSSLMEEQVSRIKLDANALENAARLTNRLTESYVPALSIIRLLVESQGIVLAGKSLTAKLPGFMFDMNAFFQELLSRFLRENLPGFTVRDEHGLKGMMRYSPKFNPNNRRSPTPRPDYAILKHGKLVALLDAKYRDLWEKPLPREMLYQLVVYAVSQPARPVSSILYPTLTPQAREARIDVAHPLNGNKIGQVCLRPVNLNRIEELISADNAAARRKRTAYAECLAFE